MDFPDVQEEAFVLEMATETENIAAQFAAFMAECAGIFESVWKELIRPRSEVVGVLALPF